MTEWSVSLTSIAFYRDSPPYKPNGLRATDKLYIDLLPINNIHLEEAGVILSSRALRSASAASNAAYAAYYAANKAAYYWAVNFPVEGLVTPELIYILSNYAVVAFN